MTDNRLLKAEAGVSAEGANLSLDVGVQVPGVLARLFPTRTAKASARRLISEGILRKIASDQPLDLADAQYAAEIFDEAEAKWIRRQEIAARAARVLPLLPSPREPPMLPEASPAAPSPETPQSERTTADDWINRFWDDAGLVSDETLQEIYARILASEARAPGSCSMKTLRVLRYLDRYTAEQFATLAALAFSFDWIPREDTLLGKFGVSYSLLSDLDDAGIVDSSPLVSKTFPSGQLFPRWGTKVLAVQSPTPVKLPIFPLRAPGRELARIAEVERHLPYFFSYGHWLARNLPTARIVWAELPHAAWEGPSDKIDWHQLPPESDS